MSVISIILFLLCHSLPREYVGLDSALTQLKLSALQVRIDRELLYLFSILVD